MPEALSLSPHSGALSLSSSSLPAAPPNTTSSPFAAATATASPSPCRRARKPRLVPLFLPHQEGRRGSPGCRQLRRSPPRPPRIAAVDLPPSPRPRAHRPHYRHHREPLSFSPHLPLSLASSSRRPTSSRGRRPPWPTSCSPLSLPRPSVLPTVLLGPPRCGLATWFPRGRAVPCARAPPSSGHRTCRHCHCYGPP